MVLSELKMETLIFKPTFKDRLFYDKYEYGLNFKLKHVNFVRGLSHESIDHRAHWHNMHSTRRYTSIVDDEARKNLHDLLDRLTSLGEHKVVFTCDYVYIYSNSVTDLQSFITLPYTQHYWATQAVINRARDTLLLKNPKHQYRTFFRERYMTKESTNVLVKFLLSRGDCFRITRELHRKLSKGNNFYTLSHYFVDHNNMQDLVMLQLVCPDVVRKTLTIKAK